MAAVITPLDPASPKGIEVAKRLSRVLAEIRAEMAAEEPAAERPIRRRKPAA